MEQDKTDLCGDAHSADAIEPNLNAADNGATAANSAVEANGTKSLDGHDRAHSACEATEQDCAQGEAMPESAPRSARTYDAPLAFCAVDAARRADDDDSGARNANHNDDFDDDLGDDDLDMDLDSILAGHLNMLAAQGQTIFDAGGQYIASPPGDADPSDIGQRRDVSDVAVVARARPSAEDEPQAKRHRGQTATTATTPNAPRRPRGRPPGRTNGNRRRPITFKRFVRDAPDAPVREECVARVVRTRLDAMQRGADGRNAVDADNVRLSAADDASLPPALCFRRTLEPLAQERIYACVGPGCGRTFACLAQNALLGCTGVAPDAAGAGASVDPDDALDSEDRLARAVEGMPVEGFVCPIHGEHHAYCARCLLGRLDLDTRVAGVDDRNYFESGCAAADAQLAGRWPVRCPGSVRVWLDAPPSVGMCSLPPGATVASIDASVASMATVAQCPFVIGPRFARALVERCPPADARYALAATFTAAKAKCAKDAEVCMAPDNDDDVDPDIYNRDDDYDNDNDDGASGGGVVVDVNNDDEREAQRDVEQGDGAYATNSVARRALRFTRQKGLARLMAAAEVEYRRHATATNPQYWVSTCPYDHCPMPTHVDRARVFGVVCITCEGCRRLYCLGCRDRLDGCDSATVVKHTYECYDHRHAPWFGNDVHFLGRFLRDPATAAAASDRHRLARPEASDAQSAHTPLQILLDTTGGAGVRLAIAARIAECLLRADRNGSSQRCPTCHRRVNLAEARAHTAAAATEALGRARAAGDAVAMDAHARRLAGVYSTAVDFCACGTVWCYLCERIMPTSRAQRVAIQGGRDDGDVSSSSPTVPRVDLGVSMAPYSALPVDFDPPPAEMRKCPAVPAVAENGQVLGEADAADAQAWWTEREAARIYWHEAPEHGPWRHTADWSRHERASQRCDAHVRNDPLWAHKWPACPPSMADLGDLRDAGFVDHRTLSAAGSSPMPSPLARALAGRANLERFHVAKRQRLVTEVMRCVEATPWIGPDMVAAIRRWLLPTGAWRRIERTHGAFCRLADAASGARQLWQLPLARDDSPDAAPYRCQPQREQPQQPHQQSWNCQRAHTQEATPMDSITMADATTTVTTTATTTMVQRGSGAHDMAHRAPTEEDISWVDMLTTPVQSVPLQ
ncbi:hypothetical protein psal_cds_47 [Pandoravirus salinus]|uniref:Uncharacterized protein n=1 Tax=Pandoravirus salinus TaxID=1349410 RepID=S4W037_9VIRU|nr:hypothetical protein psal_cds_47 [Pandoravirus salinus]AGO83435.1 hypothetical protein psal_cds_47 [Pandoravirus salinus]